MTQRSVLTLTAWTLGVPLAIVALFALTIVSGLVCEVLARKLGFSDLAGIVAALLFVLGALGFACGLLDLAGRSEAA